jgi:protein tyrosine/serine phosphatase
MVASLAADKAVQTQPELPNFHIVHQYLLRGGAPSKLGLQKLRDSGVATVIDLRAPTERTFDEPEICKALGMNYLNLPMSSAAPTNEQVAKFEYLVLASEKQLGSVNHSRVNASGTYFSGSNKSQVGSVFVHCAHGSDRTGCMVGIWRVVHDHWPYDQAYREMRRYWFGPQYKDLAKAVKVRAAIK